MGKPKLIEVDGRLYRGFDNAGRAMGLGNGSLRRRKALKDYETGRRYSIDGHEVRILGDFPASRDMRSVRDTTRPLRVECDGRQYRTMTEASLALGRSGTYLSARIARMPPPVQARIIGTPAQGGEPFLYDGHRLRIIGEGRAAPCDKRRGRPVRIDGERYGSIRAASREADIPYSTLAGALFKGRETVTSSTTGRVHAIGYEDRDER